ncbi:MAG: class I SAM-dependent methyltransferase [Planctomycetota bacterium]
MGITEKYTIREMRSKFSLSARRMVWQLYRFEKIVEPAGITGRRVLEIGAGTGIFSCLLSLSGAKSVTSLEPELAGHSNGAFKQFYSNIAEFDLRNISLLKETFQDFGASDNSFDLILSVASINHLEESACKVLHRDAEAQKIYRDLFLKFYNLLDKGGKIVISDCGRRNLFSWPEKYLHMKNPVAPDIEWAKHQQPSLWAKMLKETGFEKVDWRWLFPYKFYGLEKFLNSAVMAYVTTSFFVLSGEK